MTIDKYTKFILTLIAVGILGLNFYLYDINIVKKAYAISNNVVVSHISKIINAQTEDLKYSNNVVVSQISKIINAQTEDLKYSIFAVCKN